MSRSQIPISFSNTPRYTSPLGPIFPVSYNTKPTSFTKGPEVIPTSFTQKVKEGFSLGIGVSIARNLVDSFFTKKESNETKPTIESSKLKPCATQEYLFNNCITDKMPVHICESKLADLHACYEKQMSYN